MSEQDGETRCVQSLKRWVETEAEFNGRTDGDFLLMFLRSCNFDMKLTKKTLTLYYENRVTIPQWWTDRDLRQPNIWKIFQSKSITALIDKDPLQPTILTLRFTRYESKSEELNYICKLNTLIMDAVIRRMSSQLNGIVLIIDCLDSPSWLAWQIFWPSFVQNFVQSFYNSLPVKIKTIVILNAPTLAHAFYKLLQPFLSSSVTSKVYFKNSSSGWEQLHELVSKQWLPVEMGGNAGPISQHEDAFVNELIALSDRLLEDDKYGFSSVENN